MDVHVITWQLKEGVRDGAYTHTSRKISQEDFKIYDVLLFGFGGSGPEFEVFVRSGNVYVFVNGRMIGTNLEEIPVYPGMVATIIDRRKVREEHTVVRVEVLVDPTEDTLKAFFFMISPDGIWPRW